MKYILNIGFGAVNSRSISDLIHAGVSFLNDFDLFGWCTDTSAVRRQHYIQERAI
jgi:hypothetical protein